MISNVISTARKCGSYGANFLFGTGSNTVGKEIKDVYNARKTLNLSRTQAIRQGFKDGQRVGEPVASFAFRFGWKDHPCDPWQLCGRIG